MVGNGGREMLNKCIITGFADEIHRDLDVQLEIIGDLGQKYIELRGADGINIADILEYETKILEKTDKWFS